MNKIGIYYAYWLKNLESDVIPYIERASDLGFDVLEIFAATLYDRSKEYRKKVRKAAEENDIELTFSLGLRKDMDVSSADPKVRERGINYLEDLIKMVDELGGECFSGILYGAWGAPFENDELNKEAHFKRSIESMKEVMNTAEKYEVSCNMEAVNRFEHFLINTSEEAVDYVKEVDSPYCNILLDTYHMNIEEDSFSEALELAGDKLGSFHIGENNRKPPGQGGHLPWSEIFGAVKKIGYDGRIVMEPFVVPGGDIAQDIALWRDLSEGIDLDEEAKKAIKFTKQHLS